MNPPRYFTAIFCDDVRREEGNKLSFMGIYTGVLGLPSFPTALSKLCVVLTLRTSPTTIPARLRFRLMLDDQLLAESRISDDALAAARAAKIDDDQQAQFNTIFQLSPFVAAQSCFLRARADCDDEEFQGGSLYVQLIEKLDPAKWGVTMPEPRD